MKLIVISGAEATCKSSLAKDIAKQLGYAYRSKDIVKEKLFDTEGHNTWDFKWYESKAKEDFLKIIIDLINNSQDAVIESNFIGKDKVRLSKLITPKVELVEIHCYTKGYKSFNHFVERNESKKRHVGHHDRRWYPKVWFQTTMHLSKLNIGAHKPMGLSNRVMNLDTTNFPKIDYVRLMHFISS